MAQQFIAGGQTSASVTDEINDNFTELYNRDAGFDSEITTLQNQVTALTNQLNSMDIVVSTGTSGSINTGIWYWRIYRSGFYEGWYRRNWIIGESGDGGIISPSKDIDDFYTYTTPIVPYPTELQAYFHNIRPDEYAQIHSNIGAVYGAAKSTKNFNTKEHSGQYVIGRTAPDLFTGTGIELLLHITNSMEWNH